MSSVVSGILLDIEGTTSSIHFVYEQMFPYVRAALEGFLAAEWSSPEVAAAVVQIRVDAGLTETSGLPEWPAASPSDAQRAWVAQHVLQLMDSDAKTTGLKQLQGLIWRSGFEQGALVAHVYDDVPPALRHWQAAGLDVRIYSSGSILAQQLFFAHTAYGDLLPFFRGHYDTTIGGKKEAASYERIAREFARDSGELLFVSDVTAELDAAAAAGYQTALSVRPENPPITSKHAHRAITSFDQLI